MEFITTHEAGKRLGINRARVIALIQEGRIPAQKVGRDWLIRPEDLSRFERRPQGNFKLTQEQIAQIKARISKGARPAELAREFGVSERTIYRRLRK